MVPSVVRDGTRSRAEVLLFDVLKVLEMPGWTAFHSLNVSEHEYKRWGELDFVLLSPVGLFAIEVKGGGVSCHDGLWTYTDRDGVEHTSSEGPFRQASSGLMGLRDRLSNEIPSDRLSALMLGYGVAFPQTAFDVDSVEWDRRTVLDRKTMERRDGVASWLRRLVECWREHTRMHREAPEALVAQVRQLLRPEFDRVPPLSVKVGEVVNRMEHLTEEQYAHLDFVEANDRNVIEGGAGTGKTFLALELLRREAARGHTVQYVCQSPPLARFVSERAPVTARVAAFETVRSNLDPGRVDYLVVDEAQDLMSMEDLSLLTRLVRGGLEAGCWTFFLDPNTQSRLSGSFDPETLDFLRSMASRGILRRNCRNTEEIVLQTRLLTGADLGNPMAGAGPQVSYVYYESRQQDAVQLEAHLDDLRRSGVADSEVTVLSPVDFELSAASAVGRLAGGSAAAASATKFATISDFKGLENDFIALVDIDRLEDDLDVARLYVGMTRARAGLWIAMRQDVKPRLVEAVRGRGFDGVIAGGSR